MATTPVTLDMSKSVPIAPDAGATGGITLDMSKSIPVSADNSQAAFDARRAAGVGVNPALKTSGDGPTGVAGLASGAANEGMKTISGLGELTNKVVGVDPVKAVMGSSMPDSADLENKTPSQKIGGFAETVGEFATGEELLDGLTKFSKIEKLAKNSPTIADYLAKTPGIIKRIIGTGAKAATVGGAQGAVKGAAEGDAKGGAETGAIGGAVGGAAGEVLGAVAKPIANKLGIATSAEEDAMKAFQPGKREKDFLNNWATAKDRIVRAVGKDGKFEDWTDATERLRTVRQDLWKDEFKPKIDAHSSEEMFAKGTTKEGADAGQIAADPEKYNELFPQGNPVASAIRARITPAMQKVSPASAKAIETFAKRFDGPMKVGEAEELAEHINAELQDAGYWKKSASERAAADKANPALAARSAAVEAIRNSLADHLEAAGETGVKQLKKEYGAIAALENHARGRINVDGRARPISLKQIVGAGAGIAHGGVGGVVMGTALPLLDKLYNDPIALLNRAAAKEAPGAIRSTVNKVVGAGVENAGDIGGNLGSQAGQWIKFRGSDGQAYEAHPDEWKSVQAADPGATQIQ